MAKNQDAPKKETKKKSEKTLKEKRAEKKAKKAAKQTNPQANNRSTLVLLCAPVIILQVIILGIFANASLSDWSADAEDMGRCRCMPG